MSERKPVPGMEQLIAEASKLNSIHTGMALNLVGILRNMKKSVYEGDVDALVCRFLLIKLTLEANDADVSTIFVRILHQRQECLKALFIEN